MMAESYGDSFGLRAAAEHLVDQVSHLVGLAGYEVIENCRRLLERPPLVAVAGRVNTGKSTLVAISPEPGEPFDATLHNGVAGIPPPTPTLLSELPESCVPAGGQWEEYFVPPTWRSTGNEDEKETIGTSTASNCFK